MSFSSGSTATITTKGTEVSTATLQPITVSGASHATLANIFSRPLPGEYYAEARLARRTQGSGMDTTDMLAHSSARGHGPARLDGDYLRQWREEKAAAVARGEDPYADIARRAREKYERSWPAKVRRGIQKGWRRMVNNAARRNRGGKRTEEEEAEKIWEGEGGI